MAVSSQIRLVCINYHREYFPPGKVRPITFPPKSFNQKKYNSSSECLEEFAHTYVKNTIFQCQALKGQTGTLFRTSGIACSGLAVVNTIG